MMIYTLTPNPSIDRTILIPEIRFNSVLRSDRIRLDLGGKGFNVSRSLLTFGIESMAIAWVGGASGKILSDGLLGLGVQTDFVWVDQETRGNTMIIEESGDWYIKVNEPGPPISKYAVDQLFKKVEGHARKGDWWVLSGSLPPDVPVDFYADLIKMLNSRGARVYLDARGEALHHGYLAVPYLVKPNAQEASHIVDFEVADQEDAKRAALPFLRSGVSFFALTMGSMGLLLATQQEMVFAKPPKVVAHNTAGSGDALLAALLYAESQGKELAEMAAWGVAAGTASVETEGVSEFDLEKVQALKTEVEVQVINIM